MLSQRGVRSNGLIFPTLCQWVSGGFSVIRRVNVAAGFRRHGMGREIGMRSGKLLLAGLAGGVLVVGAAGSASANSITITINTPIVTALPDGTFEWAYGATLSAGSEI